MRRWIGRNSAQPPGLTSTPGSDPRTRPRRCRDLAERLATRLAAVFVVPQTLASLEGLVAAWAGVGPLVRVCPLVGPHCRGVFEPLTADAALLAQFVCMLEQYMLLQMVAFLEPVPTTIHDGTVQALAVWELA